MTTIEFTVRGAFAHITDIHLNPLNKIPAARTDTYHEDTRKELEGFREWCVENNIKGVFVSGDLFNLKNSALYSPEHILYYRDVIAAFPCPWYVIPGNHDLPQSAYTNLQKSAYKLLCESCPNFIDVADRVEIITLEDGLQVAVSGVPYVAPSDFKERALALSEKLPKGMINFTLIHTDITPSSDGSNTFFEALSFDEVMDALPATHVICAGHIHLSYPIYNRRHANGTAQMLSKPYSAARLVKDYYTTMEELAERHVPTATLFQCRRTEQSALSLHAEYKALPHVSFEHAFIPETLQRELEKAEQVHSFLEAIKAQFGSVADAFQIDTPEDYLKRMDIPAHVRAVIAEYLEE